MSDETQPLADPETPVAPRRGRPPGTTVRGRTSARDLIQSLDSAAEEEAEQLADATDPSGEMLYEITVQRSQEAGAQQDIMLGPNGRTVILKRGHKVVVDAGILDCLNNAVETFYEDAPTAEDMYAKRPAERMRFPYILHRTIAKK